MTMKKALYAVLSLVMAILPMSINAKKLHTIGDSSMCDYNEETTKKGWGQMLQQYLVGIEVNNRAKSGASSKSFYQAPDYWASSVKKQISPGDIVLIQFSHNDEKSDGMDGDEVIAYYKSIGDNAKANSADSRGTSPFNTYKQYLRKYIEETRSLGAEPILVGSICRNYFSGSTIRRSGRHDLGDSFSTLTENGPVSGQRIPESDHTMDYIYHMREVAEEMNVPFVDLTAATKDLYESYGSAVATDLLFCLEDQSHLNARGATIVARLFCELARQQGILTEYIKLTGELTSSPASIDFGNAYKGYSKTRELCISGFSLTPASGNITVTAPEGLLLSTDKINYSQQVVIPYEDGTAIATVYATAKFGDGSISGDITATNGSQTLVIPFVGTGIVLGGDTEASAYWRLESDDNCEVKGPITSLGQSLVGMEVQSYKAPNANTVWPEETGFTSDRKTQRTIISGGEWPADDIDEVPTRYIEYAVKAAGNTVNIDRISMYLCGCGGNGMRCKVYYSKEDDFANPVLMKAYATMPSNTMLLTEAIPVMTLSGDEVLRVRIYPWYNGAATGKSLCISDVTIHGMADDNGENTCTSGSVIWSFSEGVNSSTLAETTVPDLISSASLSLGDNLYIKGMGTVKTTGTALTILNPSESVSGAVDDNTYLCLSVIPEEGVMFIPTRLRFTAARFGTDGGYIDVVAVRDGIETSIAKILNPNRDNSPEGESIYDFDLSEINIGSRLDIYLRIYKLANNKQIGFRDISIDGDFYGKAAGAPVDIATDVDYDAETMYYNLQGIRVESLAKGQVYIVVRSGRVTKELCR